MTGTQIYNAIWVFVWLMLGIGGVFGIIAGNPAHWFTTGAALLFAVMMFNDNEDGESLKDLVTNKIKALRAHKG